MTTLLILLLLILPAVVAGQSEPDSTEVPQCGTVFTPEQLEFERGRAHSAPWMALSVTGQTEYTIPVQIHIVRPTGYDPDLMPEADVFTLDRLNLAMYDLNRVFIQAHWEFYIYGEVSYIDDDYYYDMIASGATFWELRHVSPVPEAVNVYFTFRAPSLGSTSVYPGNSGILMRNNAAGVSYNPSTFAHEMGHYFSLMHTHQLWPGDPDPIYECPNGSNCETAGDLICDTPADPDLGYRVDANCEYDHSVEPPPGCDDTPYDPQTDNLMSYSRQDCRDYFSPQQITKMIYVLENERPELEYTSRSCCEGRVGDTNRIGGDEPDLADIFQLLDMLFLTKHPVYCFAEADVNQSGGADPTAEDVTLSDLAVLIDYLYITGPSLGLPDCL